MVIATKGRCDQANATGAGSTHPRTGNTYTGEFRDNQHNGVGKLTFANGDVYFGHWLEGKRHGQGIEYASNGSIRYSGTWSEGKLESSYPLSGDRFPFSAGDATILAGAARATEVAQLERERLAANAKERESLLATEIEAERRKRQSLEAQLAAIQPPAMPPVTPTTGDADIRNAHALVIGNAAYPGSARLDNPINDATAISQKLRSMGFTVTTVTNANRQRLVQAMAQFRRSAASADMSLLFYSGHGVQIFGTNYILPIDLDQTDTAQATIQGVRLNEVIENFMPGKTKIVFLDACRDNPLQRTGDRSVTKGLAPISVAEGTLISYATKDGQVAADGVGSKNSPFTQALLEHLADPQDIGVVLRKVREKVMRATGGKQQPWDYGSLTGGELVLSRVRATER
jgi:hypothetical protein